MSKRSRSKEKEIICTHCSQPIISDGGKVKIPLVVTLDIVPGTAYLHNKCLKPYLNRIEMLKERQLADKTLTPYRWQEKIAQ